MNGKHPVDELFAQKLRAAEAEPPAGLWDRIARERDRRKAGAAWWSRFAGIAALLALLAGGIGYWATSGPQAGTATHAAVDPDPAITPEPAVPSGEQADREGVGHGQEDSSGGPGEQASVGAAPTDGAAKTASGRTAAPESGSSERASQPKDHPATHASGNPRDTSDRTGSRSTTDGHPSSPINAPGISASVPVTKNDMISPRRAEDEHLGALIAMTTPLARPTPQQPGDQAPNAKVVPYVLTRSDVWIGIQGEWADVNGRWSGPSALTEELNAAETWRDRAGLSLWVGRVWRSGLSLGIGFGLEQQRSRFFRRTIEPATTQTVIDTTWVTSSQGPQTLYTWDIVETAIVEPGSEQLYSATNTYRRMRLATEVAYPVFEHRRWSIHARVSPELIMTLSRTGNTLAQSDGGEGGGGRAVVVPLNDRSLDERFSPFWGLSAGVDIRFRIHEHISLSAVPAYNRIFATSAADRVRPGGSELGGALRIRYHLAGKERPMPATLPEAIP